MKIGDTPVLRGDRPTKLYRINNLHAEVQPDTVVKPPKPREYPVCPEQSSQCVTEQTIGETVGRGSCPAKPSLLGRCYTEADARLTEAVL